MKIFRALLIFCVSLYISDASLAAIQNNFPETEPIRGFGFTNAFQGLNFVEPIFMTSPPGETNELFIGERSGRILVITNLSNPTITVFLDLQQATYEQGLETGLLSLAFHPNYKDNGRFFVFRTTSTAGLRDQLSEFSRNPNDPYSALPTSEKILIAQIDGNDGHNSGCLQFGPDGYLYVSLGDTSPLLDDIHDSPQAIDKGFFSGIIRIDVDNAPENLEPNPHEAFRGGYRIPWDNPFVGVQSFNGLPVDPNKVRTEFYAIGFRNMWRFSFDPYSGKIIGGDVGEGTYEEIDVVQKGGNYGWPYMEGPEQEIVAPPGVQEGFKPPLVSYLHGEIQTKGRAVMGGVVYTGKQLPEIVGKYLYGDFITGSVWAIDQNSNNPQPTWIACERGLSSFGRDPRNGDILVTSFREGSIKRLVYIEPGASGVPESLAETGIFSDLSNLVPQSELIPYQINVPFWSDNALKTRWMLPAASGEKIAFQAATPWTLPKGSMWVKHFDLELTNGVPSSTKRIETRVLMKTDTGGYGLTYRWGDSLTNAYLVPQEGLSEDFAINQNGITVTQTWNYPSWQQCKDCHNSTAGVALGFNTLQLNLLKPRSITNQLDLLAQLGCFSNPEAIHSAQLPKLADLQDAQNPVQYRARSWLNANCSQCHQPGGFAGTVWDARITTPLASASIIDAPLTVGGPARIVAYHDPANSYLWWRPGIRDERYQMPPFGTTITDDSAITMLADWINTLPDQKWASADIGSYRMEGSAEQRGSSLLVSGTGAGIAEDSIFLLFQTANGSVQISSQLTTNSSASTLAQQGLMLRNDQSPSSYAATIYQQDSKLFFAIRGLESSSFTIQANVPAPSQPWLKLVRVDGIVSGWWSLDHSNWNVLGSASLQLNPTVLAGLFSTSASTGPVYNIATFDAAMIDSVQLISPKSGSAVTLPAVISLASSVEGDSSATGQIVYLDNQTPISEAVPAPFVFSWKGPVNAEKAGIQAVLETSRGSLTSSVASIQWDIPPDMAKSNNRDNLTLGNWANDYGTEAHLIPNVVNVKTESAEISILQGQSVTLEANSTNPSALVVQGGRVLSAVSDSQMVELEFSTSDFLIHKGAFSFLSTNNADLTDQIRVVGENGEILLQSTLSVGTNGVYFKFGFNNTVRVQITGNMEPVMIIGAFCDPAPPPIISIVQPLPGQSFNQPANVAVKVEASSADVPISEVDLWDNNSLIATWPAPPYQVELTNLWAGTHSLRAIAVNDFSQTSTTGAVMEVLAPPAQAAFLGFDTVSGGSWKGRYGNEGFWIFGEPPLLPSALDVPDPGEKLFYFEYPSGAPQALQSSTNDISFEACLVSDSPWHFDFNVLDGATHEIAVYFLDPSAARVQTLDLSDPSTGTVLDSRKLSDYEGEYGVWRIKGSVRLSLTPLIGNSIASAIFVDPVTPYSEWKKTFFSLNDLATLGDGFDSSDEDGDQMPNILEYAFGQNPLVENPTKSMSCEIQQDSLVITLKMQAVRNDVRFEFDESTDLQNWSSISAQATRTVHDDSTEERVLTIPFASGVPHHFVRIGARIDLTLAH